MASTAHKTARECKERFDAADVLNVKLDTLATWVRDSKHTVVFTGAGVSTSCGIPDYRSGMGTALPTGPGVWTLKAATKRAGGRWPPRRPTPGAAPKDAMRQKMLTAIPSATHMSLVALHDAGLLAHVVTQNVDGLHRRSGLPPDAVSALHGSTNIERCSGKKGCGREYMRDFRVRRRGNKVHNHVTGRACAVCGGKLRDTIVNFGEGLPEATLGRAFREARAADLCIVLGSSLRVTPAADVPEAAAKRGGRLVIVNLQATPLDHDAALLVNAMVDDAMTGLMAKLGVAVPPFKLVRHVEVGGTTSAPPPAASAAGAVVVRPEVRGVDVDGAPFTLVKQAAVSVCRAFRGGATPAGGGGDDWVPFKAGTRFTGPKASRFAAKVKLTFFGHYNEPDLVVPMFPGPPRGLATHATTVRRLRLELDPLARTWTVTDAHDAVHDAASAVPPAGAGDGDGDGASASARAGAGAGSGVAA